MTINPQSKEKPAVEFPEAKERYSSFKDISDIRSKINERAHEAISGLEKENVPVYIDAGMEMAEKYELQQKLNRLVLYLDDPENKRTQRIVKRISKYWDKLPGLVQAEIIHNMAFNDPVHLVLRIMAKTGLLEYKRAEKAADTKTISESTKKALKWIFNILKYFVDDLKDIDEDIVNAIMKGAGFADNMLFNAKLNLENARRERELQLHAVMPDASGGGEESKESEEKPAESSKVRPIRRKAPVKKAA